jgi:hypothetical protein
MSTGDPKGPDQELRPQLFIDEDVFYPVALGPTLAQLLEKRAQEALKPGDVAGYLAVELASAEMREEVRLSLPFETFKLIAEVLVRPAVWAKLANAGRAEAVRPRDEKLQDRANALYSSEVEATEIAEAFLDDDDPALRDLLVFKNEDGDDVLMKDGTPKLMKFDTLRKIIARRHERQK